MRHVEIHSVLESTNTRGCEAGADARTEPPLLILAEQQTAGRGRGPNRWWSGPGALTFSVVFDSDDFGLSPDRWPRIALCAAVAVQDLLRTAAPGCPAGIKWPNDVWLRGKKVCGTLVEPIPRALERPARIVVGIGLNLNNSMLSAPDEIQRIATSVCDEASRAQDAQAALIQLLNRLGECLRQLGSGEEAQATLAGHWQDASVLTGRTVAVRHGEDSFRGRCLGIGIDGGLLLESPGGEIRQLYAGVVAAIE